MKDTNTIFALASAPGRAGVAVIRVSGPSAEKCVNTLSELDNLKPGMARYATLRKTGGEELDRALVLWFAAPHSFTGENVAEFQVHGGRAIVEAVCSELGKIPGVRPAGPGEFSRRAVENGKLELTQAEAILDLVDAETEAQRRQALRQHDGALGRLYEGWRSELIAISAGLEATIDFSEEEIPEGLLEKARRDAAALRTKIAAHLADGRRGELVREGLQLVVIGPPNAGKSSLVNALAQREVAIVASTPGTTRDVVEVHLDLGGYAVILADTAGLRETEEAVEREGVRRALARAEKADLVVRLLDGSDPSADPSAYAVEGHAITVWNKSDLPWPVEREGVRISVRTGEGLEALVAEIAAAARRRLDGGGVALTRPRHRYCLEEACAALMRADKATATELFAEDLRMAVRAIGRITGRVDVEDILDVVFRDFCIGK